MDLEIKQQYLNNIVDNIASIHAKTSTLNYESFRKETMIREEIYAELQEIGKTSQEMLSMDEEVTVLNELQVLANFENATFQTHMDIQHQQVWNIITQDLKEISKHLERSPEYNLNVA